MVNAIEPGRVTFDEKMVVRKAIEEAKIPFTYVSANCFAGYFAGNLSQFGTLVPPKEKVIIYGDGNSKGTFQKKNLMTSNLCQRSNAEICMQSYSWTKMI